MLSRGPEIESERAIRKKAYDIYARQTCCQLSSFTVQHHQMTGEGTVELSKET